MSVVQFDRRNEAGAEIINIVDEWWRTHNREPIWKTIISDFGFLSFVDGKPILISFFYPLLGTELCLWGWQVSNPESTYSERTKAIEEISEAMVKFGKGLGYKMLVSYTGNSSMVKRFEDLGFQSGDEIVSQFFKEL